MRHQGSELLFFGGVLSGLCAVWSACSQRGHSCTETRTCPKPVSFIDAGTVGDWWDPSSGGATAGAIAGEGGAPSSTPLPSDGGEAGASTGAAAVSAPAIIAVSPANGAVGVTSDASIVITFDRAMNEAALSAAYRSPDLPASALSFDWNAARTVLRLEPKAPLSYQTGGAALNGAVTFAAKSYHFSFTGQAVDEQGQALAPASFGFSTLRLVSAEIPADPALSGNYTNGEGEGIHNCVRNAQLPDAPAVCIGDDANNVRYVGFISFDLSTLPPSIDQITNAALLADGTVHGSTASLGASKLEHVGFGELGEAAIASPAAANLGPFFPNPSPPSGSSVRLDLDVTSSVAADYAAASSAKQSQFRLSFSSIAVNYGWDDVELATNRIALSLTYLMP